MCARIFRSGQCHNAAGALGRVLGVLKGDTIVATTIDAGGCDQRGNPVAPCGNPQTGPLHLERVEPGGTLTWIDFTRTGPVGSPYGPGP